jgi:hypothetical protein
LSKREGEREREKGYLGSSREELEAEEGVDEYEYKPDQLIVCVCVCARELCQE